MKLKYILEMSSAERHEEHEREIFGTSCEALRGVSRLCKSRLRQDGLSSAHRAQYERLEKEVTRICKMMEEHLESYK